MPEPVTPPEPKTEKVQVEITQPTADIEAVVSRMLAPVLEGFKALAADVAKLVAAPAPKTESAPNSAEEFQTAVNAALEKYISAAKLPNTDEARAYFASQCKDADGLKAACTYYDAAPAIVPTTETHLKAPNSAKSGKQHTAEETKICALFGRKPEDLDTFDPSK